VSTVPILIPMMMSLTLVFLERAEHSPAAHHRNRSGAVPTGQPSLAVDPRHIPPLGFHTSLDAYANQYSNNVESYTSVGGHPTQGPSVGGSASAGGHSTQNPNFRYSMSVTGSPTQDPNAAFGASVGWYSDTSARGYYPHDPNAMFPTHDTNAMFPTHDTNAMFGTSAGGYPTGDPNDMPRTSTGGDCPPYHHPLDWPTNPSGASAAGCRYPQDLEGEDFTSGYEEEAYQDGEGVWDNGGVQDSQGGWYNGRVQGSQQVQGSSGAHGKRHHKEGRKARENRTDRRR
jgi:hypothetical protein